MTKTKAGHIYFIMTLFPPFFVKVGYATRLDNRVSSIQTGSPYPQWVMGTRKVRDRVEAEELLHNRFKHLRFRGEWFWPGPLLLLTALAQRFYRR